MTTLMPQRKVKARKEHRCDYCCNMIRTGTSYLRSTHIYDGDIYNWKTHKHCQEVAEKLNMFEDCDEGLTTEGFQETISNEYHDLIYERFTEAEIKKHSDVLHQLNYVRHNHKLGFVMCNHPKLKKK